MNDFFDKIDKLNDELQKFKKVKDRVNDNHLTSLQHKELSIVNTKLENIIYKIQDVSNDIDGFQYQITSSKLEVTDEERKNIEQHRKMNDTIKKFLPFIITYDMLYNHNN